MGSGRVVASRSWGIRATCTGGDWATCVWAMARWRMERVAHGEAGRRRPVDLNRGSLSGGRAGHGRAAEG
jgi:hypothetical protein